MSPRVPDAARLRALLVARLAAVRWRRVAAAAAWVVAVGVMTFPAPLAGPTPGPDAQWLLGLDLAARAHLQAGTDIVWPYGPLGFLGEPMYFFATQWVLTSAFLVLVHFGVFACVGVLFLRWRTPPWAWLVTAVALVLPQFFGGYADREGMLLSALLFVVAAADCTGTPGGLARRCNRVLGVPWPGGHDRPPRCRGRRGPVHGRGPGRPATAGRHHRSHALRDPPSGRVAVGRPESGAIPAFLRATYEILTWYPATLALQPSPSWLVAGTATAALTVFAAAAALLVGARRLGVLLLFAAPTVLVMFRDAFVRFDITRVHIYLSLLLVVSVVALGVAVSPGPAGPGARPVAGAGQPRPGGRCRGPSRVGVDPSGPAARDPLRLGGRLRSRAGPHGEAGGRQASTGAAVTAAKRAFAAEIPLTSNTVATLRTGTVEPIPWDLAAVYAYDLRWNPQPVMQSSEAFSSYLDTIDADHLAGGRRPDFVLLSTETIDGRYNPFDQPAVFRTLLDRYEPLGPPDGNQLVLRPRGTPLDDRQTTISTPCGPLTRPLAVPSAPGRLVFAAVSVSESGLGRALSSLFAPASVTIDLGSPMAAGALPVGPGTAADGLFMSVYAPDAAALGDVFSGRTTPSVSSFTLSTIAPADYGSTVCVRFWSQAAP